MKLAERVAARYREAIIRKEKGEFCVRSPNNPDWNGGCYPTEGEAKKRLQQVEFFKHKKAWEGNEPNESEDLAVTTYEASEAAADYIKRHLPRYFKIDSGTLRQIQKATYSAMADILSRKYQQ